MDNIHQLGLVVYRYSTQDLSQVVRFVALGRLRKILVRASTSATRSWTQEGSWTRALGHLGELTQVALNWWIGGLDLDLSPVLPVEGRWETTP